MLKLLSAALLLTALAIPAQAANKAYHPDPMVPVKSKPVNPNNASAACKHAMAIVKVAPPQYDKNGNPQPRFVVVHGPGCPEGVKIIFPKKK